MPYNKANISRLQRIFRSLMSALIFILVFWYPWQPNIPASGQGYFLAKDTITYVYFQEWSKPWNAYRSIGYRLFLYPFLQADRQKFLDTWHAEEKTGINVWSDNAKPLYAIAEKAEIAKKFEVVAFIQRFILAMSLSVFYLALCRWLPASIAALMFFVTLWLTPPTDPRYILSEPLTSAFTWFCGAFLLYAPKCRRTPVCFALACLCASLAFLITPRSLSLTGLCSLLFLHQAWLWARQRSWRRLADSALAFTPLLITYGYIAWLSITAGAFFLHAQWDVYYSSFYYFADSDDAQHMPTERARKYAAWYGQHREEFFNKLRNGEGRFPKIDFEHLSPVRLRAGVGDALVYLGAYEAAMEHFKNVQNISRLSIPDRGIFGKELNAGLWARHTEEILTCWWENFIGGLGYYRDVWQLQFFSSASFAINMIALVFSALTAYFCADARWPVVIMAGIHLMTVLAAAMGHFVIARYVIPTEPFLLLAGMCALWFLARRMFEGRFTNSSQSPVAAQV